eukprot:Phypoly_transcript_00098.p1 GENE.Phypoly_transcript_00098~~Phypoly_transcript_00098.p1  ORF type:complete len:2137 (+),score=447.21 Phypoly_transcript_00098:354-6764(+)
MESEEGFTELLPAQRTSIAKYYNEDQLALAIAISAGMFDVIKERLTSPSTFFDHLVFSSFIRMKKEKKSGKRVAVYFASDEEVTQAILAAVPARRRLLIQETIQAKRLSIIARVLPELRALPNYSAQNVAHIIHACDTETVKNFLFETKFKQVGQVWNKIIKFHIMSVLELLEEDLETQKPLERGELYSSYYNWGFLPTKAYARFTKNKKAMEKFLDILLKYPQISWDGPDNELESAEPGKVEVHTPALLSQGFEKFMLALPEKTTQVLLASVWLRWDGVMHYDSTCSYTVFTIRAGYSYINRYLKRALELTPEHVKFAEDQPPHNFIKEFLGYPALRPKWNTHQTLYAVRLVADYMIKHRPGVQDEQHDKWAKLWKKCLTYLTRHFSKKIEAIYSLSTTDKISKGNKLHKSLDKYNKAIAEIFDTFFPIVLENACRELPKEKGHEIKKIGVTFSTFRKFLLSRVAEIPSVHYAFEKTKADLVRLLEITNPKQKASARASAWEFIQSLLENVKKSQNQAFLPGQKEHVNRAFSDIFDFVHKHYAAEITPDEIQVLFGFDKDLTYKLFFPQLLQDPLANSASISAMFPKLSLEQRIAVYKSHKLDDLVHLAKNKSTEFVDMVTVLPIELIAEAVTKLLSTPGLIDENTRNSLVGFQDITDIKIRNSLQKMANSSNEAERNGAITSLVMATARSTDKAQLNLTLKFIREKIKNKPKDERAALLEVVRTKGSEFLLPKGAGHEQFAIWLDMLTDALESPDLDKAVNDKSDFNLHPVLKFFSLFANDGFDKCVEEYGKNFDPAIFDFSAELLWRLTVFRHGEKKAAQDLFRIKFDSEVFKRNSEGTEEGKSEELDAEKAVKGVLKLLPHYVAAYEKRIVPRNPDWKENYEYFEKFISFAPKTWPQIPELVEVVRAQINRIKDEASKDDDGLYIIPSDDKFTSVLSIVEDMPNKLWEGIVAEVVDLTMHSRIATKLLSKWVAWKEEGAKSAREFKERRDKYVPELLKISASAIHLRFVWQHLVTYQQNKLDDYIGKRKAFRGVFYVGPDQRKFERSCIKTPETRRSGGRASKKEAAKNKRATQAGVITKLSDNPQKDVDEERKKEKKIQKELRAVPKESWDHEDFFYLEACYGLRRLLPRQVNVLAQDWAVQALNEDRAVPHRVKSTARWTIMPTTSYNDVVVFLNNNENANEKRKGLPVNLVETLLRGVMRNDEPIAPLNFLLSPKFLSTDRSRASVYAITQSIGYMPQDGLTSILKLCLTGKLRQQLKVSSYKEIIRLLASIPTDEHLDIILREWKRPDLHRDLRIAVIVSAMQFLHSKDERFNTIAWQILEKAATLHEEPEILTALLATKEEHTNHSFAVENQSRYFSNARTAAHLKALTKRAIPSQHAKRFGEKVVGVIASSASSDDIRFVATGCLQNWPVLELMLDLMLKYLLNFSRKSLLYSEIPSKRKLYASQWCLIVDHFEDKALSKSENGQKVITLATALCTEIAACNERAQRVILIDLAYYMLAALPRKVNFKPGEEEQLLSVFKEKVHDIFAEKLLSRRKKQLSNSYWSDKKEPAEAYVALVRDGALFANAYPTIIENSFYSELLEGLIAYCNTKDDFVQKLLATLQEEPVPSDSYGYTYFLQKAGLEAISKHKHVCQAHPQATLKFWEKVFNFSAKHKDIPREHQNASKTFDVESLGKHISEVLSDEIKKSEGEVPKYPKGTPEVIGAIARRYLEVLEKGEGKDDFAHQIGTYLLKNSKVIAEAAPENLLGPIAQNLVLSSKDAFEIVPKLISDLEGANKTEAKDAIINGLLANLDRTKSRGILLSLLPAQENFARAYPEVVENFVADVIPNLALNFPGDNTIEHKVNLVVQCVFAACGYNLSDEDSGNDSASRVMDTYLPKYIAQPKPKAKREEQAASGITLEQQAVREIVFEIISRFPEWIPTFHPEKVTALTDAVIQEASNNIIPKSKALEILEELGAQMVDPDATALPTDFLEFFSDIIHLHKRTHNDQKSKEYIEISFDLAFKLAQQFPSIIRENHELGSYFLNWAISMFIREPDAKTVLEGIKEILTDDKVLPEAKKRTENDIASLVQFISSLSELKHQAFVLPQQTPTPAQSLPQYSHISHHLAYVMVRLHTTFMAFLAILI